MYPPSAAIFYPCLTHPTSPSDHFLQQRADSNFRVVLWTLLMPLRLWSLFFHLPISSLAIPYTTSSGGSYGRAGIDIDSIRRHGGVPQGAIEHRHTDSPIQRPRYE